jgi:uncharacterized protein YukE
VRGELEQARQFWTGPAGTAFDSLMRRWDDETTKLNKVLIDLEDALRGTQADKSAWRSRRCPRSRASAR